MDRRKKTLTYAVMYLTLLGFICATAAGNVLYVNDDGSADFDTIQAAVDAADDGDFIEVAPETCARQLGGDIDTGGKDIIIRCGDSNDVYISKPTGGISPVKQADLVSESRYIPNELIIKFRKASAQKLADGISRRKHIREMQLSRSLERLNERHKVRAVRSLFKDFKQHRQQISNLAGKDKRLLTKREKRILRRLKRAPAGVKAPELDRIYVVELSAGQSASEAVQEYSNDPDVEYAELNYIVHADLTPNDALYTIQWPLNNTGQMYPESGRYNHPPGTPDADIDAPEAWESETGNSEIVVAVVDTGVDYTHRDLQGNVWINETELNGDEDVDDDLNGYIDDIYGYDFLNYDNNPKDDHGHGTHCSGTIAAKGNNGLDITGVCWNAKIMGLKFLSFLGSGPISAGIEAFYYAVNNGADVVSNSWGGGGHMQSAQDAIDYAYSQGVIMAASAGNGNTSSPTYPAYYDHMFSVAATDSTDERAVFSNYGSWVDIAAPGVDVLSLRAGGTSMGTIYNSYTTIASGTSMSCPHVAGACALVLSVYPEATVDEVTDILMDSADPIAPSICQSGRLNINEAILLTVTSQGRLWLNNQAYSCSSTMEVFITDLDLKGMGTADINLITDGNDSETLTLSETGTSTGIFHGNIGLSGDAVVIEDGTLQVAHDQLITATYCDADDGTGNPATVEDTATVDCLAPEVLDVNITLNITGRIAIVRVESDEPTTAEINCGLDCGGPYEITRTDIITDTNHTITLLPLTSETDYYFEIHLTDTAGNQVVDNNEGQCYQFTTPAFLGFLVPSVYPTIQAAVDDTWNGDVIWVADGVYTGEGNRDIDFSGKDISVKSENGPDNCILDCNSTESEPHRGFHLHSEEPITATIEGFTVTNASDGIRIAGFVIGMEYRRTWGTVENCVIFGCSENGIVLNEHAFPDVNNCIIKDNRGISEPSVITRGNGIYCTKTSAPRIMNCTITNNINHGIEFFDCATSPAPLIDNCTITDNINGGIYSYYGNPDITNSIIANHKGFGIKNVHSTFSVSKCIITNNHNCGIRHHFCGISLYDSIISNNTSPVDGGGLYGSGGGATVKNCVFTGNKADYKGGAIYNNSGDNNYVNCTIIGNTTEEYGGGYYCQNPGNKNLTNCIFWGNTAPVGPQMAIGGGYADVLIEYSDVQGGQGQIPILVSNSDLTWGPGNIDVDPIFALSGDYHPLGSSPCIDAGTNSPVSGLPSTDIYGRARTLDGDDNGSAIADMGAYEFEYNSSTPVIAISQEFFKFHNYSGEPNPDDQYLSIRNCAGGTLSWEISDDSFWLETIPKEGNSTGEINEVAIRADTTTLSHGEYTGKITISDSNAINSPREIMVKLYVADDIFVPEHFHTIQEAIDATGDKSTIIVADGTYTGTGNKNINFNGKEITVKSENGPDNCTIDCQNDGTGFIFNTYEDNNSILDGFTITNGNTSEYSGGITCEDSSPTIINCKVINCQSTYYAGSGGISCEVGSPIIRNCEIKGNYSGFHGGGIYLVNSTQATVENCIVANNTTKLTFDSAYGGGICVRNDNGHYATFMNCIITNNFAENAGGGILCNNASPKFYNCTVTNNSANSGGGFYRTSGSKTPTVENCIFWDNLPNQIIANDPINLTYSDVQGGWSGEGNINADPYFVTGPEGNYYLSQVIAGQAVDSPCVDAGSDTAANLGMGELTTCTNQLFDAGTVDMGYHYPVLDSNSPLIAVNPPALDFEGKHNGANPASQTLTIYNVGSQPINWTATVDANWLSVEPNSGICPVYYDANTVTVDVNTAGLDKSKYYANITVSDPCAINSPKIIPVQLDLTTQNIADIDGDGVVDINDFVILASQWLQAPAIPTADIAPPAGDGLVDYKDLNIFCQNWLYGTHIYNLVSYWKLDRSTSDEIGSNHGYQHEGIWTTGKIDYGIYLDGVSGEFVEVFDDSSLDPTSFTISAWVYASSTPESWDTIISKADKGTYGYQIRFNADGQLTARVRVNSGTCVDVTDANAFPVGEWVFVAWTYDESSSVLYKNGLVVDSDSGGGQDASSGNPFFIGSIEWDRFFNGILDDVRIYDRALSENEVKQLYLMGI